jgi:serine/threonine protein kinase
LLTGALPFTAADPIELIHCHIAREPVPLGEFAREVPAPLSMIVTKLLAKTAEERYQTAAGVQADLRKCFTAWDSIGRIDPFPPGLQDASEWLMIPEKLYGRESETATLLAAFDRVVMHGGSELVLVSGYSGIGKSSVVNELHKVIVLPRGIFISGKFDLRLRDTPTRHWPAGLVDVLLIRNRCRLLGSFRSWPFGLATSGTLGCDRAQPVRAAISAVRNPLLSYGRRTRRVIIF